MMKRIIPIAAVLAITATQAFAAASVILNAGVASGWIPSANDNKHRFTVGVQGDYQYATTIKHFRVVIKNSAGQVVHSFPASGESGAMSVPGSGVIVYATNGTAYTAIKNPALSWGTYKVEGSVTVYAKKADGTADMTTAGTKFSQTKTIDYSVPKPYGWFTAISKYNHGLSGITVTAKIGGTAEDALDGQTLANIVRDANTKVRADSKACQECHGPGKMRPQWNAATMTKEDFCNNRVSTFNNSTSKPSALKDLFNVWKQRGCPD